MTQNLTIAQVAMTLPQPNFPQQLGGANQLSTIPENLGELKLAELKAIARRLDLMAQVVAMGPLNRKVSYIKALEADREQQYEVATSSNSECDRYIEKSEQQTLEETDEFRHELGDFVILEKAGIAYLETPEFTYQFLAGLGDRSLAQSVNPETLSSVIAHLQKFNERTSFPTTFAQAVFALQLPSQPPTSLMDWAQKLKQVFTAVGASGMALLVAAVPLVSALAIPNNATTSQASQAPILAKSYCQEHPKDLSV